MLFCDRRKMLNRALAGIVFVVGFLHNAEAGDKLLFLRSDARSFSGSLTHSTEELQCSKQESLRTIWSQTTSLSEEQEDEVLDAMTECNQSCKPNSTCIIGHEDAVSAIQNDEIAYLFVSDLDTVCVEVYEEGSTGHSYFRLVEHLGRDDFGKLLLQDGRNFSLVASKPFVAFLKEQSLYGLPPIFRYTSCLLDNQRYNFTASGNGVFGMRKPAFTRGVIPRPSKSFHCHLTRNALAMESYVKRVSEAEENDIMKCVKGKSGDCVFGFEDTNHAFLGNNLMVLVLTGKSVFMTVEYTNSITGKSITQHIKYDPRFSGEDIVFNGVVHFFKGCIPYSEFLGRQAKEHTLIVRNSRCVRGFNDHTFDTYFEGIAGLRFTSTDFSNGVVDAQITVQSQIGKEGNASVLEIAVVSTTSKPKEQDVGENDIDLVTEENEPVLIASFPNIQSSSSTPFTIAVADEIDVGSSPSQADKPSSEAKLETTSSHSTKAVQDSTSVDLKSVEKTINPTQNSIFVNDDAISTQNVTKVDCLSNSVMKIKITLAVVYLNFVIIFGIY